MLLLLGLSGLALGAPTALHTPRERVLTIESGADIGEAACRAVELAQAQELSEEGGAPPGWWTVELREGTYSGLSAEGARCLGAGVPLTIQGRAGETAMLTGGQRIPSSKLTKAGKALTVSLPSLGLPLGSYGGVDFLSCGALSSIEVFLNGEPLTLARWPNIDPSSGYWQWGSVKTVENDGGGGNGHGGGGSGGGGARFTVATAKSASCDHPVTAAQLLAWSKEKDLWGQ